MHVLVACYKYNLLTNNSTTINLGIQLPGLSVSILSYCGEVTMGIIVDKCLLSNPSLLVTGFEEKVYELARELNVIEDEGKDEPDPPTKEE